MVFGYRTLLLSYPRGGKDVAFLVEGYRSEAVEFIHNLLHLLGVPCFDGFSKDAGPRMHRTYTMCSGQVHLDGVVFFDPGVSEKLQLRPYRSQG